MENFGPFNFFFTLSAADYRWPENFTSLIRNKKIVYSLNNIFEEVLVDGKGLKDFLEDNQSKHEFIRKNLLNATFNFQERVRMFFKHIILSSGTDFTIKHWSYKIEFALRGAAHVHGILWVDWEKFKWYDETGKDCPAKKELLTNALEDVRNQIPLKKEALGVIGEFVDKFVSCSTKDKEVNDVVKTVNTHHHTMSCR